ncbi:MAG: hypothetical protein KKF41_00255 [Actinobacteria bacterium]|nr:hypothetical protein [Actinomycetota bacterium]MBU1942677.1 hypothetical protein [Actinomycetota bacterium]MBU2685999.1 hypothetical protein [Actinomycetota bacterium]
MVETLPLDMLLSLGLGMAFALAQGDREQNKPVLKSTYFLVGLAFHFVVAFGVALLCYILEPDWMWMYFTAHEYVPTAVVAFVFAGYFLMYALGFLLVKAVRELSGTAAWAVFGCDLALIAVFIGTTWHRLWYVGTFGMYYGHPVPYGDPSRLQAISSTTLFWVLLVAMPFAVIGLLAVLWLLRKHFEAAPSEETAEVTGA